MLHVNCQCNIRSLYKDNNFVFKDDKSNVDKNQVQSLLVLELMTLQLFYGLQGKSHLVGAEETAHARLTIMSDGSRDVLMQSMEGLLEVFPGFSLNIYHYLS